MKNLKKDLDDVVKAAKTLAAKIEKLQNNLEAGERRGVPGWVEIDRQELTGTVKALPTREELTMPIQEQLIVELYSK